MTDRREPLWASSLADQPQSGYDDVRVRWLEEPEEDEPPQPQPAPPDAPREPRTGRALLAGIAAAAVLLVAEPGGALTVEEVPSYWGDVPMTCDTVRLEGDTPAEWFWCRAVGGRSLPAGLFVSPESQWTSDITRRDARHSRIRITRDGDVTGWATY